MRVAGAPRRGAARRPDAVPHRPRGVPAPPRAPGVRAHPHRAAHRRGPGRGPSPRPRRGRRPLPDQAVLAAGAADADPLAGAGGAAVAGSVGLSQALSYARDLKSLYETSRARERELERRRGPWRSGEREGAGASGSRGGTPPAGGGARARPPRNSPATRTPPPRPGPRATPTPPSAPSPATPRAITPRTNAHTNDDTS